MPLLAKISEIFGRHNVSFSGAASGNNAVI
jgi:hypothetical protein